MREPIIICIYGPTASGKSALATMMARCIPIEVINCDVGQFCAPLHIGTAKPDLAQEPMPHHLFNIIQNPHDQITAVQYRALVMEQAHAIRKRGAIPIIVGGSGFYMRSLWFAVPSGYASKEQVAKNIDETNTWQELYVIDPQRAQAIHPNDQYRIDRALAIWHATGTLPSEYQPRYEPWCSMRLIMVNRDREDLHARVAARTAEMMKSGWLEEAATYLDTPWREWIENKGLIGYTELFEYLKKPTHSAEMLSPVQEQIIFNTVAYAKRQNTFGRMMARTLAAAALADTHGYTVTVDHVNLTHTNAEIYSNQLCTQYRSYVSSHE